MANAAQGLTGDTKRLLEIVKVMSKYKVMQGFDPDKLCEMLKELGPTFVKLGQLLSMHPEIIPMEYCKKLESLRTDASTLVTAQIREIISEEYGKPWNAVFERILPIPLGAASIAQVHEAILLDGTHVAVKVQRPDIYNKMERDVRLIKKALDIVKFKSINNVMNLCDCIDEMWLVAQEEMDFFREAENIRTIRRNNEGVQYVYCPRVYDELTTKNVLVMEYIGGFELNNTEEMRRQGYNVHEVCTKFINNYIKQFAEDRFFHADPHPGNIRVQDGRIVWLDLGMMGRLTEKDAELVTSCMRAIFSNDYLKFADNLEYTPLGRAEWIKFLGLLTGKEKEAQKIFNQVEAEYNALLQQSKEATNKPKVLVENMYEGVWYVPGGNSVSAQMLNDAGATYPWAQDKRNGSLPLTYEEVLAKAGDADIWLLKVFGQQLTKASLAEMDKRYTQFQPYKTGKIWYSDTSTSGLFDYSAFHPETVLSDYLIIIHPELAKGKTPRYFKQIAP